MKELTKIQIRTCKKLIYWNELVLCILYKYIYIYIKENRDPKLEVQF